MLDKLTLSEFRRASWRGVMRYLGFREEPTAPQGRLRRHYRCWRDKLLKRSVSIVLVSLVGRHKRLSFFWMWSWRGNQFRLVSHVLSPSDNILDRCRRKHGMPQRSGSVPPVQSVLHTIRGTDYPRLLGGKVKIIRLHPV
jgi:hypothetical protein